MLSIAREAPATILDENDRVIVFLSLENHPLVAPKEHIPNIYAMSADVDAGVMEEAKGGAGGEGGPAM